MKITPTMVIDTKPAEPDDLPVVLEILAETAVWLQAKGFDPWPLPPADTREQQMASAMARDELYTVGIVKNRFGVVCFTWNDPHWLDDNLAGYVPLMAVRSEMHGQNLGGLILFWAMMKAKRENKQFLRLDCLAGNGRLRRYYEEQGFTYRGQRTDQDYVAALYGKDINQHT
jgi:GNAT superfamily N-acetyltransferase